MGLVATSASATFTIEVDYSGPSEYESYFTDAASTWETLLVGYQDGAIQIVSAGSSYAGAPLNTPLTTVYITAEIAAIDGPGMVLGSAGPTAVAGDASNYLLTTNGAMTFDIVDTPGLVTNGSFGDVVLHEMAHVLGFGTLWSVQFASQVWNDYSPLGSGEFTGPNATFYWQNEFSESGTPDVELQGGPGTADGHWNENFGGAGTTGIVSADGDMRNELMTGWLNAPTFISDMTIASFMDIGFIGSVAAVPEASSFLALGLVFATGAAKSRRRTGA